MKNTLFSLLSDFYNLTDEQRSNESEVEKYFSEIAKKLFFGGYIQAGSKRIYIHEIEFYYHQEGSGTNKIKDYAMYHTNDRLLNDCPNNNYQYNYAPIGMLYVHNSGLDILFENEEKQTRASILIREVCVDEGVDGYILPEVKEKYKCDPQQRRYERRITYMYGELLSSGTIFEPNGIVIKWVDLDDEDGKIDNEIRINVKKYTPDGEPLMNDGKQEYDEDRKWRFFILSNENK